MADMVQVLATGGTALVSAAVGAGLTYWFGATNRRHQEAREDRTRWYEARLQAYTEFSGALSEGYFITTRPQIGIEEKQRLAQKLMDVLGTIELVGSPEVTEAARILALESAKEIAKGVDYDLGRLNPLRSTFERVARNDLGHPSP
jgi:hypothetical protein